MFAATAKDGTRVQYRDAKRYRYLWCWFLALVPASSVALFFSPIGLWATLLPFLFPYAIIPVADAIIGEDTHNPPSEVVSAMAADAYYSWIVRATVPLMWIGFVATIWLVGTQELPWWSLLALVLGVGLISGNAITIGHELGHKTGKADRVFAMWANALVGYAHFRVEHNHGHHVWVSTPEDPASARMGESVYRFALREIPGALKNGWAFESARMLKQDKAVFSRENELLQGWSITLAAGAILIAVFGWKIAPFLLLHHLLGWFALTQANYIEHYGLLRQKLENGRYEPCRPHHSWNSNHIFSNLVSFHLQRHSDHHSNPMRPYQALRDLPDIPRLPSGYPGMFVLAAIPPLFFRVMDPKVLAWADGDIRKVNLRDSEREKLPQS